MLARRGPCSGAARRPLMVMRLAAHRPPAFDGDAKDRDRDHQGDDRISNGHAYADEQRAPDDAETDQAVGACVVAVGDQSSAVELLPGPKPNLGRNLVTPEADDPRRRQGEEMIGRGWVDDLLKSEEPGYAGADEN